MLDIIKSEFYKVRKAKLTLVTALCLMGVAGMNIGLMLYARFTDGLMHEILSDIKGVDIYAEFMRGSFFLIFVAMFVGGMVANEYSNRTIRQVVSRGTSRIQIVTGQYIALSTSMTIMSLIPTVITTIIGSLCWEFGEISLKRFLLVVLGQIIMIWGYAAFSMLIAYLTRSGGLAIGLNIAFLMAGSTASSILAILTGKEWFNTYWLIAMQDAASNYTITAAKQGKFIAILFGFCIVCFALALMRFKIKDVE